jgi:serine/threonine-protein kinase RsbW
MHQYGQAKRLESVMIDLGLEGTLQLAQLHSLAEVRCVADRLESWMRVHGYQWKDIFAVKLVLHEAASNAIRHGNRRDPAKCVRIRFLVTPAEVLIGVEDEGQGFDLERVGTNLTDEFQDRPGNRGLILIRAYSTWVTFDPPGNRVTMCRRRSV